MPGQIPDIVNIYRIIHADNAEYLLTHGMFTKNHTMADPDYINIGDTGLITQRSDYPVGIDPPNGILGEYIPFYFGPLSPMLLNIVTGYRGIKRRQHEEIIYIICELNEITKNCSEWCFTDGHAKDTYTEFYNDVKYLSEVDWEIVSAKQWKPESDDRDRMRRKQAEFLVRNHVSVNCISQIVVFNKQKKTIIEELIKRLGLNIEVLINPQNQFYYI